MTLVEKRFLSLEWTRRYTTASEVERSVQQWGAIMSQSGDQMEEDLQGKMSLVAEPAAPDVSMLCENVLWELRCLNLVIISCGVRVNAM